MTSYQNSNCDVVVLLKNREVFVEIKRKSAEEKQILPELFEDRLAGLQLPFGIIPELFCRNYDCSDLDSQIEGLRDHVRQFESNPSPRLRFPPPFVCTSFKIWFRAKGIEDLSFFQPDFDTQIKSYIVGAQEPGARNSSKRPMIIEALEKGADYLFVDVPSWCGTAQLAEACFGEIRKLTENFFLSSSSAFCGLAGVALIADAQRFSLVSNSKNMLIENAGHCCQ